jgi:GNAT superfamily N-acetyltransferase
MPEMLAAVPARDGEAMAWRAASVDDAATVHALYLTTPGYFDMISIPIPTVAEVAVELRAAAGDERRRVELLLVDAPGASDDLIRDPNGGASVIGVLDYKLAYPEADDATVNLVLVHGSVQGRGYGAAAVRGLEGRLRGRVRRLLAAVYGRNPAACGFWEHLGYRFALDARPLLDWYAKEIG